jgi:SAM-dependent methyltransferase
MKFSGPSNISFHVNEYIRAHAGEFQGKTVVDIPAGDGRTSEVLLSAGAEVRAYDLFTDVFKPGQINSEYADLTRTLPIESESCDIIICQEGIEHLADQLFALSEFNRILKPDGRLFITTPNYSSLRAKLAYLLLESETRNLMPPNELDSLWSPPGTTSKRVYFGHIFMIGVQKLRMLGWLSGFRLREMHHTRINWTSALLLPIFYPFIWLRSLLTYRRSLRRNTAFSDEQKRETYQRIRKLICDPKILVEQHLFVELTKVEGQSVVQARLNGEEGLQQT